MHYFTTRFVDGLWDDIRMVVTLQRPSTLDTAYSLALLQEEVAASTPKTDTTRLGFRPQHKPTLAQSRLPGADKEMGDKAPAMDQDDKLSTLQAYRHARGLCEVYAEKWVRGHKCAATVSLQAMQEVWDFFNIEPASEDTDEPDEQLLLALSHDARMGSHDQRTIRFHGTMSWPFCCRVD